MLTGGPRKIAASTTPIITVQPISVPCTRQAQSIAGWKKSGKGRNESLKKFSSVSRPLNGILNLSKAGLARDLVVPLWRQLTVFDVSMMFFK